MGYSCSLLGQISGDCMLVRARHGVLYTSNLLLVALNTTIFVSLIEDLLDGVRWIFSPMVRLIKLALWQARLDSILDHIGAEHIVFLWTSRLDSFVHFLRFIVLEHESFVFVHLNEILGRFDALGLAASGWWLLVALIVMFEVDATWDVQFYLALVALT